MTAVSSTEGTPAKRGRPTKEKDPQYEFAVYAVTTDRDDEYREDVLNSHSARGWEFVTLEPGHARSYYIFRKKVK